MHDQSANLLDLRALGLRPDRREALVQKLRTVFPEKANEPLLGPLADSLIYRKAFDRSRLQRGAAEDCFLDNLASIQTLTSGHPRRLLLNRSLIGASERYDFLSTRIDGEWGLLETLNFLALGSIVPTKRVAVLTSARNEGINLLEWIGHYRALGADSIFVYTNDNEDGSDALLRLLADHKVITLVENDTRLETNVQVKMFHHAVWFLPELYDHEWFLFVDIDEFFVPSGGLRTLGDVVQSLETLPHAVSGACFNWKWFGSDSEFARTPGLHFERFRSSAKNPHVKTLSRLRDVTGFKTAHLPRLVSGGTLVDGNFAPLRNVINDVSPAYTYGQINHYWNKSFEEFLVKRHRGGGMSNELRDYAHFFEWAWGNMDKGDADPFPNWLAEAVRSEIGVLRGLPYVARAAGEVETEFAALLARITAGTNPRELYLEALLRVKGTVTR